MDELKVLKEQIDKDDFGDVYKMIEDATEKSFEDLIFRACYIIIIETFISLYT